MRAIHLPAQRQDTRPSQALINKSIRVLKYAAIGVAAFAVIHFVSEVPYYICRGLVAISEIGGAR